MKTRITNTKYPAYKLNSYRNIFYTGRNRLEVMNELLGAQQNLTNEHKIKSGTAGSEKLITQMWWKD